MPLKQPWPGAIDPQIASVIANAPLFWTRPVYVMYSTLLLLALGILTSPAGRPEDGGEARKPFVLVTLAKFCVAVMAAVSVGATEPLTMLSGDVVVWAAATDKKAPRVRPVKLVAVLPVYVMYSLKILIQPVAGKSAVLA